jgi:arylsulfatase A-like enzyme
MYLTDDTVLAKLLSPDDNLRRLDTNTLWNHVDLCQTTTQFFSFFDKFHDPGPVFFYSQPLNVHQFANNSHPTARQNGWQRPGFSARISNSVHQVDECIGQFIANLKARNLYDNSVIVLTSDHGEATGELGRSMHAEIIYPEVMHVPLIVHLPTSMRHQWKWNTDELAALTDISPSLYALAGHEDLRTHPLWGHSLFGHSEQELQAHARHELFMASDTRAAYGILAQDGRCFYATYDAPAQSYLYDLSSDPEGTRDILTPELKRSYDRQILGFLREIADFYGYRPGLHNLLAAE